ncbi:MAG: 50S ribosomal protein L25 [Acidimicrobiales bacterium]
MDIVLTAETGRPTGSRAAGRLRREGKIPGVVYGLGMIPVAVTVPWPDLRRALTTAAGLNALINLKVAGQDRLTIVKDMQRHPIRRDVMHVDFLAVDVDVAIEVEVPITLTGEAHEVSVQGGLVDQAMHRLAVMAKPGDIPDELTLDVSGLSLGATLTVADIALPAGVTANAAPDEVVVSTSITRAAASEAEEGAEAEAGGAEGGGDGGEEG